MKSFFRFLFSVRTIVLALLVLAILGGGGYLWWYSTAGTAGPGFTHGKPSCGRTSTPPSRPPARSSRKIR